MDGNPATRCRWYQFRLSTVLVLVGICAWVMALRPWGDWYYRSYIVTSFEQSPRQVAEIELAWLEGRFNCEIRIARDSPSRRKSILLLSAGPTQISFPALALLAFLTYKWTWPRVVRWRVRRRERAAADSPA